MASDKLAAARFSNDEIDVAAILLQLPRLTLEQDLRSRVLFSWGSRRKRSGFPIENDDVRGNPPGDNISPPPRRAAEEDAKADEAPSPATPLSFSPSESDGHRRPRHERKRKKLLRKIEKLTERKELMEGEIRNVSRYYDKLEAFNWVLKAKKKELINVKVSQKTNMNGQFGFDQSNHNDIQDENQEIDRQPLIFSDTIIPYDNNQVGVPGLPDLNAPIETEEESLAMYTPLDHSAMADRNITKLKASEARRKRILICRDRAKNSTRLR